jgi:FkbM family methyltransferase
MRTVIEVGMNNGSDTYNYLNSDTIVYGFEPIVEMYNHLQQQFKGDERVKLIPLAVDIENKFTHFNIAAWQDWGCSSLHDFTPNVSERWNNFNFHYTNKQKVMTIRLDDFCRMYNITSIDFLHVDAQGNDFNVLKSLGSYIDVVKAGKVEVSYNVPLYNEVDNSYESVTKWLTEKGFSFTETYDHPVYKAEANITFTRN